MVVKVKKTLFYLILIVVLISPVLAEDYKDVSITEDGSHFISIPSEKNVVYSHDSVIPQDGTMILSIGYNDTYMVKTIDSIKFVTINMKKVEENSIIEILFWWL